MSNENLVSGFAIPIKPYTTKELAKFYNVSTKVLLKWMRPFKSIIGKKNGWYFNVLQVETIFTLLGAPKIDGQY